MREDLDGPPRGPPQNGFQRAADNAVTTVVARWSMIFTAGMITLVIVPGAAFVANRILTAQDRVAEKQELMERNFVQLQTQVLNIVSSQTSSARNISDRVEGGEKVLNDRITAQGTWVQDLSRKLDDLSRYVYQKVR